MRCALPLCSCPFLPLAFVRGRGAARPRQPRQGAPRQRVPTTGRLALRPAAIFQIRCLDWQGISLCEECEIRKKRNKRKKIHDASPLFSPDSLFSLISLCSLFSHRQRIRRERPPVFSRKMLMRRWASSCCKTGCKRSFGTCP